MNATAPIADYMHFNSIDYDPSDDTFVLSFRHLDSVIKIAPRAPHPGMPIPIMWVLGGKLDQFGLAPAQRFYHQHDPRVLGHSGGQLELSLFDNNNGHYDEHPSGAMVFSIGEGQRTAQLVDQYYDSVMSAAQGSVQVLEPRHYLICWGQVPEITETVDGSAVFRMDFPGRLVYRAQKAP